MAQFGLSIAPFHIDVNSAQYRLLQKLCSLLLSENTKSNLTAIRDTEGVWRKHFIDSLSCALALSFDDGKEVIDVGSGAGFPALPLAICFVHSRFTCLEATAKKAAFIQLAVHELGLNNVSVCNERAETAGHLPAMRQNYDLVLSRAVAKTAVLAELCLPLCKINGYWLTQKDAKASLEIAQGQKAVTMLGGSLKESIKISIDGQERLLNVYTKVKKTPLAYPRRDGLPAQNPLQ